MEMDGAMVKTSSAKKATFLRATSNTIKTAECQRYTNFIFIDGSGMYTCIT